jgi:glucan phosphoethanolaminetransferase (alkaline phosphatase superfamily)
VGEFDSPISVAAFDAQHVEFFNPAGLLDGGVHDDALIAPLRNAIGASSKDLFIVLHTMGSHQPYPARYPAAFARFKPAAQEADANDPSLIENAYDNSIVFTDHFLASVIDVLARSGAIATLFYVADHGEMLPNRECRASGHGFSGLPVYEVPALFWYSTAYQREFPDKVAALEAHRSSPVSTSNIFQSLADMVNIDFSGKDTSRSLFNADWQPHRRLVHADTTVDFDHKAVVSGCEVVVPPQSAHTTPQGSSSGEQGGALTQAKQQ